MEIKKETFKVLVSWYSSHVIEVVAETHGEARRHVEDNFDLQKAIEDSNEMDYIVEFDYHND